MHLAFLLSGRPLRLFRTPGDDKGELIGRAIIGGSRAGAYFREVPQSTSTVGAMLRPGAAEVLFGVSAAELAARHTSLDELWGTAAVRVLDQLSEVRTPVRRLAILEAALEARLPAIRRLHPAVAHALKRLPYVSVGELVKETGYSHRRVIATFRDEVGLAPKIYCRLLRFQGVLQLVSTNPDVCWSDLALRAGYCDQSHLTREFREFSGLTPEDYRRLAPRRASHVPLAT